MFLLKLTIISWAIIILAIILECIFEYTFYGKEERQVTNLRKNIYKYWLMVNIILVPIAMIAVVLIKL